LGTAAGDFLKPFKDVGYCPNLIPLETRETD